MSKILTINHTCDHDCEHLHKSLKKEFADPVLQGLSVELEQKYHDMTEAMLAEILEFLDVDKSEISKGLSGHKYVKRTGGPGNYKYWYKMPDGSLQAGKNAPEGHPHHDPEAPKHTMGAKTVVVSKQGGKRAPELPRKGEKPAAQSNTGKKKITVNTKNKPSQKTKPVSTLGGYKPITRTNLVGETDFSNVDPKTAANLHKALNGAELVMQAMNIKLKTPLKFVSVDYPDETAEAFYHPDENKIEFVKHNPDSATIMHEIGHAVDIAMSSTSNYNFNQFYEDVQDGTLDETNLNPAQSLMYDIIKEAKASPYYQEARAGHKSYLNDPTEIFARAFEMHSFKVATDLVDAGKLPKDFLHNFMPDLNRTSSFRNTETNAKIQAENEALNKEILNAVISKDKPTEIRLRAKQKEIQTNLAQLKQTVEGAGRGDAAINRISDMVGRLLKLEKIKKSNDR